MIKVRELIISLKSNFKKLRPPNSELLVRSKGFTLIEIIIVIIILAIISGVTIKFLVDSMRVYTMTVNQKTLFDEGKLALERMCRDVRDANSINSPVAGASGSSITFIRTYATGPGQDNVNETITFRMTGSNLEKVKATIPYIIAENVSTFTVTRDTSNEIKLQLTLSLGSGENLILQTKVYPKNFPTSATYKTFFQNWMEAISS